MTFTKQLQSRFAKIFEKANDKTRKIYVMRVCACFESDLDWLRKVSVVKVCDLFQKEMRFLRTRNRSSLERNMT